MARQENIKRNTLQPRPIEILPSVTPEHYERQSKVYLPLVQVRKTEHQPKDTAASGPNTKIQVFLCPRSKCRKLFCTKMDLSRHQEQCGKMEDFVADPSTTNPLLCPPRLSEGLSNFLECNPTPRTKPLVYVCCGQRFAKASTMREHIAVKHHQQTPAHKDLQL